MEWYLPFTIIPGVGLIILSSSNILLNLNTEISTLKSENKKYNDIITLKLQQMKRLSWSLTLQYLGLFLFLISGIVSALFNNLGLLSKCILIAWVGFIGMAIGLLILFAFKSVNIRQKHLKI